MISSVVPSSRKRGIFQRRYTGPATVDPSAPTELAAAEELDALLTGAAELDDELETTGALLVCEDVDEAAEETTDEAVEEATELEAGLVVLGKDPAGAASILNQLMLYPFVKAVIPNICGPASIVTMRSTSTHF